MMYESFAREGTKTKRRKLRQAIRDTLGISRDPAPNVYQSLRAATQLSAVLLDASDGAYSLLVVRHDDSYGVPAYTNLMEHQKLMRPSELSQLLRNRYEATQGSLTRLP